jgi:hypothetical protein
MQNISNLLLFYMLLKDTSVCLLNDLVIEMVLLITNWYEGSCTFVEYKKKDYTWL